MNDLKVFENQEFGQVRAIEQNGEPWFVAADVCRVLEVGNSRQALTRLDEDEKGVISTDTPGGSQMMSIVNEPGLYSLVLGSRKPQAKAFKRWITHDVIPSIRKHGAYATPETIDSILSDPDNAIRLLMELKNERQKNEQLAGEKAALAKETVALTVENQVMRPKADYFDELVDRNLLTNFRDAAKQLMVKERDFIRFLMDKGYIYRDAHGNLKPKANGKSDGLFEVKECYNDKTGWRGCQTLITPKGRETFRLLVKGM